VTGGSGSRDDGAAAFAPLPNAEWRLSGDRASGWLVTRPGSPASVLSIHLIERPGPTHEVALESAALETAPDDPALAALLAWAEGFARRELAGAPGVTGPVTLRFDTGSAASESLVRLLADHGLELAVAEDEMTLDLAGTSPLGLPIGPEWQPWTDRTAPAFFAVYSAAFRDRPGFPGWDEATWRGRMTGSPDFRPDLSVLLHDGDEAAAYALVWLEGSDGWIVQMGVRPASRRRGLGRRLLQIATGQLVREGAKRAFLSVNVNNPGAAALYRSFGFQLTHRFESYRRPLR